MPALLNRTNSPSDSVCLAALLALRRAAPQHVSRFLNDPQLCIVTEAARAINDLHLDDPTPALAGFAARIAGSEEPLPDALVRRVINANFRMCKASNADAVVEIATNDKLNVVMRAEAIACLTEWNSSGKRDRVTGYWRPVGARPPEAVRGVIENAAADLLSSADGALLPSVLALVGKYDIGVNDDDLTGWAVDEACSPGTRVAVLQLLAVRKVKQTPALIQKFLASKHPELRISARQLLAKSDPAAAVASVDQATRAADSTIAELQAGVKLLSEVARPDADALIAVALQDLITRPSSSTPTWRHINEIELDIVEAASKRNSGRVAERLAVYQPGTTLASELDPLAGFRPTLVGGDAAAGQLIFTGHRKAQCLRCHKVNGLGGDAGPDLSKVAERAKGNREFLLESLINPHAKLAKGFGTVTVVLDDGKVISGTVASESETTLVLRTPGGKMREIPISEIDQRVKPKSPMPPVRKVLSLRELRDVVEYLSTLR